MRERALRDKRSILFNAQEEGLAQGIAKGQAAIILKRQLLRRYGLLSADSR